MFLGETPWHALQLVAVECAEMLLESRRLDDGAELLEMGADVLADRVELVRLRRVHAAADPDALR